MESANSSTTTQLDVDVDALVATLQDITSRRDSEDMPPPVTPTTPLEDLGLDSLEVVELFLGLETLAGRELEPPPANWRGTVADLLSLRPAEDGTAI